MHAPPRPNTTKLRTPTSKPRRAPGHSGLTFCNRECGVCDDNMRRKSADYAAQHDADAYATRGEARWFQARDIYRAAHKA